MVNLSTNQHRPITRRDSGESSKHNHKKFCFANLFSPPTNHNRPTDRREVVKNTITKNFASPTCSTHQPTNTDQPTEGRWSSKHHQKFSLHKPAVVLHNLAVNPIDRPTGGRWSKTRSQKILRRQLVQPPNQSSKHHQKFSLHKPEWSCTT